MHDEDLREEFNAWLRPVREADPPGMPAIRRRLRRRRTRQAVGGTAALAIAAGIAVVAGTTLSALRAPAGPASGVSTPDLTSNIPATTSAPRKVQGGYLSTAAYTVSSPVSALSVGSGAGTVTVTGSRRSTVLVSERITFGSKDSPPSMVRNLTRKTLTLRYACSNCGVDYDIQVPRGVSVDVSTGTGDVRLSSLSGNVAVSTNVGNITADGLSSGNSGFTADVGNIDVAFAAPPTRGVHVGASAGDVTVRVPGTVTYQVNIRPGEGAATVSVPHSLSSRYVIEASSNEGNVLVEPSSLRGYRSRRAVRASAGSGPVRTR